MKINFLLESYGGLKHVGCATAALYLMKGLKKQGIDVYLNSAKRDFDIVHAHTFGPQVMMMLSTGRVKVLSGHSTPSLNKGNLLGGVRIWNAFYKNIYNFFDYVLPVSYVSKRELEKIGVAAKMKVVYNCVNPERFRFSRERRNHFRKQQKIPEDQLVVLNVAQLVPRKGIFEFLEIAKKLPDAQFIWVGGLPYSLMTPNYTKIKLAVQNPPENVRFLGFIDDIVNAYCGADIFLTNSHAESFGMTVLEAASCGIPSVATDLPVFREVFGNSPVYAKRNSDFIKGIEKLRNPKTRKIRGKRCLRMSRKYSSQNVTKDLIEFYKSIV
jgi:1,2-diacylglycerol-3-alpha-glucose alpha-1,2-galactosyltransferase